MRDVDDVIPVAEQERLSDYIRECVLNLGWDEKELCIRWWHVRWWHHIKG
jgi:hypothetical protein